MIDERLQELESALAHATTSAEKLAVYHDIVYHCQTAEQHIAARYHRAMMRLAKREGDVLAQVHALRQYTSNLILNGDLDKAQRLCHKAATLLQSINEHRYNAAIHRTLGVICDEKGDYANALHHYYVGLRFAEEAGDIPATLPLYLNISSFLHNRLANHRKAIQYSLRAYKAARSLGDWRLFAIACAHLAEFYFSLDNIPKGKRYLDEGMRIAQKYNLSHALLFLRSTLARYYTLLPDHTKAAALFQEALDEAEQRGNFVSVFTDMTKLADCYIRLKQWQKAEQVMQRFELMKKHYDSVGDIEGILERRAELAVHKKQFPQALRYLEELLKIKQEEYHSDLHQKMDILEKSFTIERYRKEKEDAEQLATERLEFILRMSNRIEPSLKVIAETTERVLANNSATQQQEQWYAIADSIRRLEKLMKDILDISTIDAGRLTIEKEAMNLDELLKRVQQTVAIKAAEKNLSLSLIINPDVPTILWADTTRLAQILINLCVNAVRFSHKGSITVKVTCEGKRRGKEQKLRFDVSDQGIGMNKEQRTKLFQRFEQGGKTMYRKFGGTGLGLNISKQVVENMGGTISVQSKLGKGSVFSVILPMQVVGDEE